MKELLINFYRETFKQKFLQPLNVFIGEISALENLIKYIIYLTLIIYFFGFRPSPWFIVCLALVITLVCWYLGKKLIKHRIPHRQNEITNTLNPQMEKLNQIAEKLGIK